MLQHGPCFSSFRERRAGGSGPILRDVWAEVRCRPQPRPKTLGQYCPNHKNALIIHPLPRITNTHRVSTLPAAQRTPARAPSSYDNGLLTPVGSSWFAGLSASSCLTKIFVGNLLLVARRKIASPST